MSTSKPSSQTLKVKSPPVQTLIIRETHHISSACSDKRWLTINSVDHTYLSLEKALDRYLSSHKLLTSFETVTTCGTINITVIRVTTFVFVFSPLEQTRSVTSHTTIEPSQIKTEAPHSVIATQCYNNLYD